MKNTYLDLITQTFDFPQDDFHLENKHLHFNGINLIEVIREYGTPLRISYLPKIGAQIRKAQQLFRNAIAQNDYKGRYHYCYCTKSSHFKFVMEKVLECGVHLETSSAFDMHILDRLIAKQKIDERTKVICNGFKTKDYAYKIIKLINDGYRFVTPVLDNKEEIEFYSSKVRSGSFNIGLRVATEEEPNFQFYTSRLGIRHSDVLPFYQAEIAGNPKIKLRMLHFFVDTGIRDSIYYWNEFQKCIKLYCELRKQCPTLSAINIGGGLPIKNSLGFDYDYPYMIDQIVRNIKEACAEEGIPEPDIYSEFGSFTVGESGAIIYSVIGQKLQNDAELWYMIDNSLMTTLPDSWGIDQRFVLLPVNKWDNSYTRVNIGGITCDNSDYYNSEAHISQLYLPRFDAAEKEPLYIGFFNTGAYQESISGYGGIKHCLIPSPQHILIDKDAAGDLKYWRYEEEQKPQDMLRILGY